MQNFMKAAIYLEEGRNLRMKGRENYTFNIGTSLNKVVELHSLGDNPVCHQVLTRNTNIRQTVDVLKVLKITQNSI